MGEVSTRIVVVAALWLAPLGCWSPAPESDKNDSTPQEQDSKSESVIFEEGFESGATEAWSKDASEQPEDEEQPKDEPEPPPE